MARIKVIRNTYGGDNYLWNGCHYIHYPKKLLHWGNVIKLRKSKKVTGSENEPVTIFMNIM